MPLFSRKKDKTRKAIAPAAIGTKVPKPIWEDSWIRTRVDPEEVADLLHGCTQEVKSRALDVPFLLLPFRPSSDPNASRTFIRNYFFPPNDRPRLQKDALIRELRMTDIMVLVSVLKWCWARLPGGVVTWDAYQAFQVGEKESQFARDAFNTFVPISVESNARVQIINDFFDLLASIAAHGMKNGLGGHKLSRYAGWWAFEHYDAGKGFDTGYRSWASAAQATSHLFFAYLRSLSPEHGRTNRILGLPRSLQQLLDSTDYPPMSSHLSVETTRVVMIVDVVSPTPYALLRRAKNFQYRDDDRALQTFSEHEDPVQALTDECRRVLKSISTANQSQVSDTQTTTSAKDPSWSRFEDLGFDSSFDENNEGDADSLVSRKRPSMQHTYSSYTRSPVMDLNRPTTPSWADFLSSGFVEENGKKSAAPVLLPPDKVLPPFASLSRGQSSQSHRRDADEAFLLEPGELASINKLEMDDSFWWVWISSLAGEEPTSRKAVFGRCALIETAIRGGQWMVMEEQVKGAAPAPPPGAYVAEKKGFLSFTKRGRLTRRSSVVKTTPVVSETQAAADPSKRTTLAPERQAKIQEAAAELMRKTQSEQAATNGVRRGRTDENDSVKTNSVFTLGPVFKDDVSPALQWARQYDKNAVRAQYLGNGLTGKGDADLLTLPPNGIAVQASSSTMSVEKSLPVTPRNEIQPKSSQTEISKLDSKVESVKVVEDPPRPALVETVVPPAPTPPMTNGHLTNGHIPADVKQKTSLPSTKAPAVRIRSTSPELTRGKRNGVEPPPRSASSKPNGIRRLFGTMRRNRDTAGLPVPDSPTDPDPAIAATRRALEGKSPKTAQPDETSASPPLSQDHFVKLAAVKATAAQDPIPQPTPTVIEPADEPEIFHNATSHIDQEPAQSMTSYTDRQPVHDMTTLHTDHQPVDEPQTQPEVLENSLPRHSENAVLPDPIPPRTRRDEEFDNLSRVDTREREQADQEFSRFDQGPLTDHSVFAAAEPPLEEDSVVKSEKHIDSHSVPPYQPKQQSIYSAVTVQSEPLEEDLPEDPLKDLNPQDRWAQIRRNAAERASKLAEEQARNKTETKTTDENETSGEETIESRVARIKARVAELTGNMENTRR